MTSNKIFVLNSLKEINTHNITYNIEFDKLEIVLHNIPSVFIIEVTPSIYQYISRVMCEHKTFRFRYCQFTLRTRINEAKYYGIICRKKKENKSDCITIEYKNQGQNFFDKLNIFMIEDDQCAFTHLKCNKQDDCKHDYCEHNNHCENNNCERDCEREILNHIRNIEITDASTGELNDLKDEIMEAITQKKTIQFANVKDMNNNIENISSLIDFLKQKIIMKDREVNNMHKKYGLVIKSLINNNLILNRYYFIMKRMVNRIKKIIGDIFS